MTSTWCFDFDGTIVDIERRYTEVYRKLMVDWGLQPVDEYWRLRREGLSEKDILIISGFPTTQISEYDKTRELLLESPDFLNFDRLFNGVVEILTYLKSRKCKIWIVTHRSNCQLVNGELEALGIKELIYDCKCTKELSQTGLAMINDHEEALGAKLRFFRSFEQEDSLVIVGDSLSDIKAAKESGSIAIGLASGLQDFKTLELANPDYLFASIVELFTNLQHRRINIPVN